MLSFVGGMLIERVIIRPVEGGEVLTLVIVTLGLYILVNSLAGWIWGFGNRAFPSLFGDGSFDVAGVRISVESIGIVAVLIAVVGDPVRRLPAHEGRPRDARRVDEPGLEPARRHLRRAHADDRLGDRGAGRRARRAR